MERGDGAGGLETEDAVRPKVPQAVAEVHQRLLHLGDRTRRQPGLERRLSCQARLQQRVRRKAKGAKGRAARQPIGCVHRRLPAATASSSTMRTVQVVTIPTAMRSPCQANEQTMLPRPSALTGDAEETSQ